MENLNTAIETLLQAQRNDDLSVVSAIALYEAANVVCGECMDLVVKRCGDTKELQIKALQVHSEHWNNLIKEVLA